MNEMHVSDLVTKLDIGTLHTTANVQSLNITVIYINPSYLT